MFSCAAQADVLHADWSRFHCATDLNIQFRVRVRLELVAVRARVSG